MHLKVYLFIYLSNYFFNFYLLSLNLIRFDYLIIESERFFKTKEFVDTIIVSWTADFICIYRYLYFYATIDLFKDCA